MFTAMNQINWMGVAVATVTTMILGFVYFGVLFGKAYADALGRVFDSKAKPAPLFIVGPAVCTLLTTITSAILLKALNLSMIGDAIAFGVLVGLGYIAATMTNIAINPNMPHPLRYAALNAPYFLLTNVLSCALLVML